ncbi:MAG: hypothetical protein U0836_14965 [Pirellulales bacterium]
MNALRWGRRLALLVAPTALLIGSATAQVLIDQDTVLDSLVQDRLIVRDSAAGQTELRIAPGGEAYDGLEAHDTAQVLVQGGTVRRSLDQFDHSRAALESGRVVGTWNLFDEAQGAVSGGLASAVKAAGDAEFSLDGGKVTRLESADRSLLNLNAGTATELNMAGRSTAEIHAVDSKMVRASDQAGVRLSAGADVAELQATGRASLDVQHGAKLGRLTLLDDSRAEANGGDLGDVTVWGGGLRIQPDVTLANLLVRDQGNFEALGARLPTIRISDSQATLSSTHHEGQLIVQGNAAVAIDAAQFAAPNGGPGALVAEGNSRVRMTNSSFVGGMDIQLSDNSVFFGGAAPDPQSATPGNLVVQLRDRAFGELYSLNNPKMGIWVRDQAELDFFGPVGQLDVTAISGGVARLSGAVQRGGIGLNPGSAVHLLSGPFTGGVTGNANARAGQGELFLHARSFNPLPQGRFTAELQDGTTADLSATGQFQLVLVDGGGRQTPIDHQLRFNPANGHFYKVVSANSPDWEAAKAMAESMSFQGAGHLATITSEQEAQFVADQFATSPLHLGLWIGGSDAEEEGVWKWVVGPEAGQGFYRGGCTPLGCSDDVATFADWYRSPSGANFEPGGGDSENYILWQSDRDLPSGSSGRWHDYPHNATSAGFLVEFEPLLGDANGDGQVGLADFGLVKRNFGSFGGFQQGDFNGDWTINLADFALLKQNFGAAAAAPAPEPSAGALAALALLGLAYAGKRSRKRAAC